MAIRVNRKHFFDQYRIRYGKLFPEQVQGLDFLLDRIENDSRLDQPLASYILATVKHETGDRFQPIREKGTPKYFVRNYDISSPVPSRSIRARQMGNVHIGDGFRYRGGGYVQLTWRSNYAKMGELLGVPLEEQPELIETPEVSYEVLVRGMLLGLFTGKRLDDYINEREVDFKGARRVVNGTDKAVTIARYAENFLTIFRTSP